MYHIMMFITMNHPICVYHPTISQ